MSRHSPNSFRIKHTSSTYAALRGPQSERREQNFSIRINRMSFLDKFVLNEARRGKPHNLMRLISMQKITMSQIAKPVAPQVRAPQRNGVSFRPRIQLKESPSRVMNWIEQKKESNGSAFGRWKTCPSDSVSDIYVKS